MKNIFSFLLLITIAVTFWGCPYQTSVSIDSPSVKIDQKLIGTWKSNSSEDNKYKIEAKDEFIYSIIKRSKGSEDEKYFGFISLINNVSFFNIYNDNGSDAPPEDYYLYRMEIKGDGIIILKELTENIDEEFASSDELKKYIIANMNNSYFYSKDEEIYTKQ